MNTCHNRKDSGFVLIMAMIVLFVLTILVVNAVRSSTMNELMAGSYMDHNRAMQAAEQALREGEAKLMTRDAGNTDYLCLQPSGCSIDANGTVAEAAAPGAARIPENWTDQGNPAAETPVTLGAGQATDASYKIALLDDSLRGGDREYCKAYSIMGQGKGIDRRTTVVLQTIAYVCPMG